MGSDGFPEEAVGGLVSRVLFSRTRATVISLAPLLPTGSGGLPGDHNGPGRACPLLDLASGGVCRAGESPRRWCALTLRACAPHLFTLTENRYPPSPRSAPPSHRIAAPAGTDSRRYAFCCTIPPVGGASRESRDRYRGWTLSTTAPWEARTFLPRFSTGGDRPAHQPPPSTILCIQPVSQKSSSRDGEARH